MNVAIIIPVVQTDLAYKLLIQLKRGLYPPDQVIIIDNSPDGFVSPIHSTQHIRPKTTPMPVNSSWRLGISHLRSNIDVVGILNDDIIVTDRFISDAIELFSTKLNCGIGVPRECKKDDILDYNLKNHYTKYYKTKKRSGWAFFIRRTILESIPPIPDNLVTFFGDAWLFQNVHLAGMYRYLMAYNPVYHYGGVTLKQGRIGRYRITRERERTLYKKMIKEIKLCRSQAQT